MKQTLRALQWLEIRDELKARFPSVKFSLRAAWATHLPNIEVDWRDGPTREAAEEVINQYETGRFNRMEDLSYEVKTGDPEKCGSKSAPIADQTNPQAMPDASVFERENRLSWHGFANPAKQVDKLVPSYAISRRRRL